ncbi:hypothetical protein Ga0100231_021230 [Opitutaceae bacterium TAV4]|nr:hypothetical protein Ga0100231_021230 [Opitutaceae bacterium TAV4]RRJ99739.1 hypothetical protein Ga0100230_016850 [Opitutaceae bacterium TAV3]
MINTLFELPAAPILPVSDHRASLFNRWLADHDGTTPVSSNQPALRLPFQRWFKFKEAFSPRFILDCVQNTDRAPQTCLDPFGGSGTTALTCQFLGILPTTIEVNPFLGDLIEAKLTRYNLPSLQRDYLRVINITRTVKVNLMTMLVGAPVTMVEPGLDGRWIFSRDAAKRILALRTAIDMIATESHRSVLRVALGSVLVGASNVVVNGKGRKYRNGWQERQKTGHDIEMGFREAFLTIYTDLARFSERPMRDFVLHRGDSRQLVDASDPVDLVIFSPPYPNSFDYTDIYNLELWLLGYLRSRTDNTLLRNQTVRSHVQIKRDFSATELESPELRRVYRALCRRRAELWDADIADMVQAYFGDMATILRQVRRKLRRGGRAFLAVGNSKYAGVIIDTPKILSELAPSVGLRCLSSSPIRSMRASAQQGGRAELHESLVVMT